MITIQNVQQFKDELAVFASLFTETDVTLVDTAATIKVPTYIGTRATGGVLRSSQAFDMTGAADQDRYTCLILYDQWENVSPGRAPKKGDVLNWGGLRYAIQRVVLIQPAGVKMAYKAELRG
jgi:hypothetical protein